MRILYSVKAIQLIIRLHCIIKIETRRAKYRIGLLKTGLLKSVALIMQWYFKCFEDVSIVKCMFLLVDNYTR